MPQRTAVEEPIVAITAFNIDRYTTVEAFLSDYRLIGLGTIELNGRVRQHVIDDLMPYVEREEIRISSLHVFCPKPDTADGEEPNLASPNEAARRLAVGYTMNTIATAHRLGARAVVVHAGVITALRPLAESVNGLYRAGERGSARFAAAREELVRQRRALRRPYLDAAERSLAELAEYAAREGGRVALGLENNLYRHFPLLEEYDDWFARYNGAPIGLWYDVGHGRCLENLGLGESAALLERHGHRLLGLHLHDCVGVDDHLVPGTGGIDFAALTPYLRPDVLRVLEYGSRVQPVGRIAEGISYLRDRGILGK